MTQVHDIRKLFFEEGKNISQVAKMTGFDRKTVIYKNLLFGALKYKYGICRDINLKLLLGLPKKNEFKIKLRILDK